MTAQRTLSLNALIALAALAALATPSTHAAMVSLDSLSWTHTGAAGLIGGTTTVPVSPAGNAPFAYVSTWGGVQGVSPLVLKSDGSGHLNL